MYPGYTPPDSCQLFNQPHHKGQLDFSTKSYLASLYDPPKHPLEATPSLHPLVDGGLPIALAEAIQLYKSTMYISPSLDAYLLERSKVDKTRENTLKNPLILKIMVKLLMLGSFDSKNV